MLRSDLSQWCPSDEPPCDVFVIGGGATGLGVAVQAALEGRRVALAEARDFAAGTSSRSTKLLHGGVRYLAQGRLRLVREALRERATVLALAPHLAQPLPFVVAESRPWARALNMLGLKAYQWLAGQRSLGATEIVPGAELCALAPTLPRGQAGIRYWDGQFEDARLALALARTAAQAGAQLRNHTRVVGLTAVQGLWEVRLHDAISGEETTVRARCVVNACGVWVDDVRALAQAKPVTHWVRPSQGVHVVVSRERLPLKAAVLVPHTQDGRVLFAIPWLGATVIGTTDTPRDDAPDEPRSLSDELDFLFRETHRCLGVRLQASDVQSVWAGLRPLVDEQGHGNGRTSTLSREHLIRRELPGLVTVTGGKWTTYRVMAEQVMAALTQAGDLPSPDQPVDTRNHRLWGAPAGPVAPLVPGMPSLQDPPGLHLWGEAAAVVAALPGHDCLLGLGLTEAMVRYAARQEWAVTVEDVLARRWRALFLNARAAQAMAPRVAEVLQAETGLDPKLDAFVQLARQYQLAEPSQGRDA